MKVMRKSQSLTRLASFLLGSLTLTACGSSLTVSPEHRVAATQAAAGQADDFHIKVDGSGLNGRIAFVSNRDTSPSTPGYQKLSLYLKDATQTRRVSTDTLPEYMDINHKFLLNSNQIGYLGNEKAGGKIALYYQSLDFTGVPANGEPPRTRLNQTANPYFSALQGELSRWDLSKSDNLAAVIEEAPLQGEVQADIFVGNNNGSMVNITQHPGMYLALHWSPDGNTLVYSYQGDIYTYIMGQEPRRLTTDQRNMEPQWSPDGTQIVYGYFNGSVSDASLRVMDRNGSHVRVLSNRPGYRARWSPDGRKIAFVANILTNFAGLSPAQVLAGEEVFCIDANGQNEVRITKNKAGDTDPVWSPDSSHIAFSSNRDGNQEIYTSLPDGTQQTNITQNPAEDYRPEWSL